MSYLLVSNFQNYVREEKTYADKKEAIEAFKKVQSHTGAFSAYLYELKPMKSWVRKMS